MVPELGHFALILALGLAVLLAVLPMAGAVTNRALWMRTGGFLAAGQFVFVALSFACLTWSFLADDFSVQYVARNSNTLLPTAFKVSAVWGAHEGSFLLWTLVMAGWTFAVAVFSRQLPADMLARVLSIMGMLGIGFLLFILMTSNPFDRLLPMAPLEGADLNPLLQDFGLIVHPPMLYTGYVGFSVAFAFAIAALLSGRLDAAWARWSRPWTNVAWAFLTLGITLGSWWAYYELGWGGWWFWDPVENASFMPWLVGTALVHSLAVTEKRGVFKSWTVLLAIATFSLSLLGAFIVRSGVLTSVHAFAVDPERGLYILIFLLLVVGGSLALYALRAPVIRSRAVFSGLSREVLLLVNNVLLVLSAAFVLLGTLYPLIYEAATGGEKISVGPPWFNLVFVPLMALLALALAAGPVAKWKRTTTAELWNRLRIPALVAVLGGLVLPLALAGAWTWQTAAASGFGLWIVAGHALDVRRRSAGRGGAWASLRRQPAGWWGMTLAHCGFAVTLVGVCLTSHHSTERDLRMLPGSTVEVGAYSVRFEGVTRVQGPNYLADQGKFIFAEIDDSSASFTLLPEKRRYLASGQVMTEAAIDPGILRDVYVALGEPLGDGAWAVRLHHKPVVRWTWLGGVLMAMGGVLAVLDGRYRRLRRRRQVGEKVGAAAGSADVTGAVVGTPATAKVST